MKIFLGMWPSDENGLFSFIAHGFESDVHVCHLRGILYISWACRIFNGLRELVVMRASWCGQ